MTTETYDRGTGRRKCAVAQVKLFPGSGQITVNGQPYQEVFSRAAHRHAIEHPFVATNTVGKYNVEVKINGGGLSGWAGATSHGIARALLKANDQFKPLLRQEGLLTRDPRVKERKKYGLRRARKAPQFTKR